jgi:hypothetical protein
MSVHLNGHHARMSEKLAQDGFTGRFQRISTALNNLAGAVPRQ